MKNSRPFHQLSLALTMSALLLSGCSSFFLGDANLSEPVDLPSNPNMVLLSHNWQTSISDGTNGKSLKLQPLVLGNSIIAVSNDGELNAFSHNGQPLWHRSIGHFITAGVSGDNNTVVVGSENGLLMAFSTATGKQQWMYQLTSEILAPPTVSNGIIVARTIDGQVTALSESQGNVKWKHNIGTAELSIRGNARTLLFGGVLLFTNDKGRLTLINLEDGKIKQDMPVTRGSGITAVERIADLLATPVVQNDMLYLSAYRHETIAINLKDGSLVWKSDIATSLDLFADKNFLYVVDKNSIIHALNLTTGRTAWSNRDLEGRGISPLAGDGNTIATIDNEGKLIVLNNQNGRIMSYTDVGGERTYVAPQWVDGKWLTFTGDGKLTLIGINGK